MRVDIWSDVVCPFCYIGKKRLEAAAEQLEINLELHWHSFQLDPNAEPLSQLSNAAYLAEKYNRTLDEGVLGVQYTRVTHGERYLVGWRIVAIGT